MKTVQPLDKTSKRTFQTIPTSVHLTNFIEQRQLTHQQLGNFFGVSGSSISTWVKHGKCPEWTRLAIEALESRHRTHDEESIIVCMPEDKERLSALMSFLRVTKIHNTVLHRKV